MGQETALPSKQKPLLWGESPELFTGAGPNETYPRGVGSQLSSYVTEMSHGRALFRSLSECVPQNRAVILQ